MAHKKNGFLNFCCSCFPGAGQMYQGFLKRGLCIMAIFFGMLMFGAFFGIDEVLFLIPVVWCFGFFDSIHRNSLSDAEHALLKDDFTFGEKDFLAKVDLKHFRVPVAVCFLVFGVYGLLREGFDVLFDYGIIPYSNAIYSIFHRFLPKAFFSFILIALGVYLVMGKKKDIDSEGEEKEA